MLNNHHRSLQDKNAFIWNSEGTYDKLGRMVFDLTLKL